MARWPDALLLHPYQTRSRSYRRQLGQVVCAGGWIGLVGIANLASHFQERQGRQRGRRVAGEIGLQRAWREWVVGSMSASLS